MRHYVAPQISENIGRHPTKSLKRLVSPLAAARRTVQLKSDAKPRPNLGFRARAAGPENDLGCADWSGQRDSNPRSRPPTKLLHASNIDPHTRGEGPSHPD